MADLRKKFFFISTNLEPSSFEHTDKADAIQGCLSSSFFSLYAVIFRHGVPLLRRVQYFVIFLLI